MMQRDETERRDALEHPLRQGIMAALEGQARSLHELREADLDRRDPSVLDHHLGVSNEPG